MTSEWDDDYFFCDDTSELPDIFHCSTVDYIDDEDFFAGGFFNCSCGGAVEDFVCTRCHNFFVEEYVEHQYKEKQKWKFDYE